MADDSGSNSATMNQEIGIAFERFKSLEYERKGLVEDMAEIVKTVADKFDLKPKNVRKAWMLAIRPPEQSDANEVEVVSAALGEFVSTPLGGAALERIAEKWIAENPE